MSRVWKASFRRETKRDECLTCMMQRIQNLCFLEPNRHPHLDKDTDTSILVASDCIAMICMILQFCTVFENLYVHGYIVSSSKHKMCES